MARKKSSETVVRRVLKEPARKSQEDLDKELIARSATHAGRLDSVEKAMRK